MKIIKSFLLFVFVCVFLTFVGCASIIHGGKQKIHVNSVPLNAVVRVNEIKVTTPSTINLSRKESDYVLKFEKFGYRPVEVKLTRTTDGWVWGNIILGGIIGTVVDYSTGAAYKLTPDNISVTLRPLNYIEDKMILSIKKEARVNDEKVEDIVLEDAQTPISSYDEYNKFIYKVISEAIERPKGSIKGIITATFKLRPDGTVKEIKFLDGSSKALSLKIAVAKAINESSPFPEFPEDMKSEAKRTFSIVIEFK